jgi:predicted Zn-dependent peptidase
MNYQKNTIKEGINLHTIKTNKFKTNLIAVFLTLPLQRKNITEEALTSAVLRRGSNNYKTTEEISIALEEMYGASFDCGIEKMGDNHVLKFYIETINEEFLPQKEEILKKQIDMIFDIVFNPFVENGTFKEEYVKMEKENLKQIIEGKKDNKARYALDRCIEEMYKNAPYGLYKYGYVEDLEKIDAKQLYEAYINITKTAKIDIFVSGKIENEEIKNIVSKNEKIIKLQERKAEFIKNNTSENVEKPKEIIEKMDITQGKLIYGITVNCNSLQDQYSAIVYNAILGGGANSKLFQNVREKASLAYTAGSSYLRQKNNIFIRLRNRNKKL